MSSGFRIWGGVAAVLALAGLSAGCGGDSIEIREQRVVQGSGGTSAQPGVASTGERFGYQRTAQAASQPAGPAYAWNAPSAWEELPPEPLRPANFRAGPDGAVEVYLSVLSGGGGGAQANVNRWREQMALEPLDEDAVAELPTARVLGRDAVLVDLQGRYEGAGAGEAVQQARLLGAILEDESNAVFVKLVGPADQVAEQKDGFDAFLASLDKPAEPSGHGHGHGHGVDDGWSHPPIDGGPGWEHPPIPGGGGMSDTAFESERPSGLDWQAPEGWRQAPDRPVRLVTYESGPNHNVETYVTVLSGTAGGVEMNVNRWRQEMGQPALGATEIAALPEVNVLGGAGKLVEVEGDYAGKTGVNMERAKMLGVIAPLDGQVVFVRMTGPLDAVREERGSFIAFCESLRLEGV